MFHHVQRNRHWRFKPFEATSYFGPLSWKTKTKLKGNEFAHSLLFSLVLSQSRWGPEVSREHGVSKRYIIFWYLREILSKKLFCFIKMAFWLLTLVSGNDWYLLDCLLRHADIRSSLIISIKLAVGRLLIAWLSRYLLFVNASCVCGFLRRTCIFCPISLDPKYCNYMTYFVNWEALEMSLLCWWHVMVSRFL